MMLKMFTALVLLSSTGARHYLVKTSDEKKRSPEFGADYSDFGPSGLGVFNTICDNLADPAQNPLCKDVAAAPIDQSTIDPGTTPGMIPSPSIPGPRGRSAQDLYDDVAFNIGNDY